MVKKRTLIFIFILIYNCLSAQLEFDDKIFTNENADFLLCFSIENDSTMSIFTFYNNEWRFSKGNFKVEENDVISFQEYYPIDQLNIKQDSFFNLKQELVFYFPTSGEIQTYASFPVFFHLKDTIIKRDGPIIKFPQNDFSDLDSFGVSIEYIDSEIIYFKTPKDRYYSFYYMFKFFYPEKNYVYTDNLKFVYKKGKIIVLNDKFRAALFDTVYYERKRFSAEEIRSLMFKDLADFTKEK